MKIAPFALAWIIASSAFSQDAAKLAQVRGVVRETGTNRGLSDVEINITLAQPSADGLRMGFKEITKIVTDARGEFRFQPEEEGTYFIKATKEGYAPQSENGAPEFGDTVQVSALGKGGADEKVITLGRSGSVTGRLVNWDSGEPITNRAVTVAPFFYLNGRPVRGTQAPEIKTDRDGQFTSKALTPGKYVIVIDPQNVKGSKRFEANPAEEDSKRIDEEYPLSFWPGGGDMENAVPLTVVSGGSVDAGTIRLRQEPFYRVHVTVSKTNCNPNEKVSVLTRSTGDQMSGVGGGETSCGADFVMKAYPRGSYVIILSQGKAGDRTLSWQSFEVVDKNLDLQATLGHGVDVEGTIVAAEGAGKIRFDELVLYPLSPGGISFGDEPGSAPDAQGKFRLINHVPLGKLYLNLLNHPRYYIKEIHYNGTIFPDGPLPWNAFAPVQTLEIVVDDQPATITGVVQDGDHSMDQPYVVLTPWPLAPMDMFMFRNAVTGDRDGNFRSRQLAPGEYRAVAVAQSDADLLNAPGVLLRLAGAAEKIQLERGAVVNLSLKRVDPSH
jgi:hypothetical protein